MRKRGHFVAAGLLAFVTSLTALAVASPAQAGPAGCFAGNTKAECKINTTKSTRAVGNCPGGNHCVYFTDFSSASHWYFDGDQNFTDDVFDHQVSSPFGPVNDNVWAAANSTSNNKESHYYYDINPSTSSRLVFCLNPDRQAILPEDDGVRGNGQGKRDEVSALIIRNRTSVRCIA